MAAKMYTIVPNADTIVILKNPILDFAPWERPELNAADTTKPQISTATSVDATDAADTTGFSATTVVADETVPASLFGGDAVVNRGEVAVTEQATEEAISTGKDNGDTDDQSPDALPAGIRYYCSAAHLKVASKVFDKALSGDWAESRKHYGLYHIVVEDWDEDALLILLNIFHTRYNAVPRFVEIERLAKLATLIDYYQCEEATAMCKEKWVDALLAIHAPPSTYDRSLMLWLCVACVFRLRSVFQATTETAINRGDDGSLRTLGFPIPQVVADLVDKKREDLMSLNIAELKTLARTYSNVDYVCPVSEDQSFTCGSLLSGALTKELEILDLTPYPSKPFDGMSLETLRWKIGCIRAVSWCAPQDWRTDVYGRRTSIPDAAHACNLKNQVSVNLAKYGMSSGLSLKECGL